MSVVFTFNSVTSTTMGLTVLDIIKPIMPGQRVSTADIPEWPGVVQLSKKFDKQDIIVKCLLKGTSYSNLISKLQALSAYLYSDTDKVLSFDDESGKYWNAQHVNTVVGQRTYIYAYLDLVFTCNDPFGYDTTPTTDSQTITVLNDTYVVANAGQYYAFPTVTITFNQNQTHVYLENNTISDNRFDIAKAFVTNDVLVVNCKNKTITLNGSNSPAGFGDGGETLAEWVMLATGNNELMIGSDDATINITVALSFEKVYFY